MFPMLDLAEVMREKSGMLNFMNIENINMKKVWMELEDNMTESTQIPYIS